MGPLHADHKTSNHTYIKKKKSLFIPSQFMNMNSTGRVALDQTVRSHQAELTTTKYAFNIVNLTSITRKIDVKLYTMTFP